MVKYKTMIKKLFTNITLFIVVFVIVSVIADIYYYNRVIQKDSSGKGQICYSDFRVLWFAAYRMNHHVLRDDSVNPPSFRPFWFLNPGLRKSVAPTGLRGEPESTYAVYDPKAAFYHYRYSPFIAFTMIPLGKFFHQGYALLTWYVILNAVFLGTILLITNLLRQNFGLREKYEYYLILWGTFFTGLRFYLMNISLGQTDVICLFLFALFLIAYVRDKEIFCGILLGLILQFKLFYFPILAYFVLIRKPKLIITTLSSFIIFLFIPDKLLTMLSNWHGILGTTVSSQILLPKNQSLIYTLATPLLHIKSIAVTITPKDLFYSLGAVLTLSAYIVLWIFKRSIKDSEKKKYRYVEISVLIMSSLLFSPIAWKAHYITVLIPFTIALAFTLNSNKKKISFIALGLFVLFGCVIGTDLTGFLPFLEKIHFLNISLGTLFLAFALVYSYRTSSGKPVN